MFLNFIRCKFTKKLITKTFFSPSLLKKIKIFHFIEFICNLHLKN